MSLRSVLCEQDPGAANTAEINASHLINSAGWHVASTVKDLILCSPLLHIIPWYKFYPNICTVKIRFRYDKRGGRYFSVRLFALVTTQDTILQFLCPVRTCLVQRWVAINGNHMTLVFCFINSKKKLVFLEDGRIDKIYRSFITCIPTKTISSKQDSRISELTQ